MKRTWPIIAVSDVQVSSKWYQTLLNANNNPAGIRLSLKFWTMMALFFSAFIIGRSRAPFVDEPAQPAPGNGLLLCFCVSDFDSTLKSARTLATQLAEEPRLNPNTRAMEFSLRDPDGYYVTVSAFNPA